MDGAGRRVHERGRSARHRSSGAGGGAERAAAEIERHLAAGAEAGRWRRFGELLLAYGSTVPPGATEITVPDFDGTPISIPLDPRRSAVVNAQAYFRRHGKAAASRRTLPESLDTLRQERAN